ncbi:hypothetical protein F5Y16DRAFT_295680 [Xylariaceae sp. FL0255]|nr:hypothetical protein F5Y16DRAFT_295680 [Xylariaceae sp. FL0255]
MLMPLHRQVIFWSFRCYVISAQPLPTPWKAIEWHILYADYWQALCQCGFKCFFPSRPSWDQSTTKKRRHWQNKYRMM